METTQTTVNLPFVPETAYRMGAGQGQRGARDNDERASRRDWLRAGAALGALLIGSGCPAIPPEDESEDLEGVPDSKKAAAVQLRKLVDRTTFGRSIDELRLAEQLGYDGYLEYQLDYTNIDDSTVESMLQAYPTLTMSVRQLVDLAETGEYPAFDELTNATILRSAYSTRQLYQKMVEFWTDHFNIYIEKDNQYFLKPIDDREVIRKHALGNFKELLSASAHSPAMLAYLDNDPSSREAPNQNYARELMELHTLGVDHYSQKDIEEVARCFTGWSINYDYDSAALGTFKFYNFIHDPRKKKVLGHEIPRRGGVRDGEIVLDILCSDPSVAPFTARHLGEKLATYFWGEHPPEGMIQDIANAYLSTDGDIKSMVRAALNPNWVNQAPRKLKRPYHFVISSLRGMKTVIQEFYGLRYLLDMMGHHPFNWAPPDGYPDSDAYWATLLLPRWRYGSLLFLQDDQVGLDLTPFFEAPNSGEFMDRVKRIIYGKNMPTKDREYLTEYLEQDPDSEFRRLETLGLSLSVSGYQWF